MEVPRHAAIFDKEWFAIFAVEANDKISANDICNMLGGNKMKAPRSIVVRDLDDKSCSSIAKWVRIPADEANAFDNLVRNSHLPKNRPHRLGANPT